jgi:precorrin-8X/cobalt-precorrin-8 methylmutase
LQLENPRTREDAINYIDGMLTEATERGRRLLCGFDFPFGYPAGTAQMLADQFSREGDRNWVVVWELIAAKIDDRPNNWNNRFEAAAKLNEAFHGEGPFWGLPTGVQIEGLLPTVAQNGWGQNLPPRRRYADYEVPRAQEVWKLFYAGSVGSQMLTGIARLERLRQRRADLLVWPFETLGTGQCHVLAEIYPSLIEPCQEHDVLDAGQVHAVATRLRELDQAGLLIGRLQAPQDMPEAVRVEEGLFLNIT